MNTFVRRLRHRFPVATKQNPRRAYASVVLVPIPLLVVRIATIDIGTNTAQLLVADATPNGPTRRHVAERFVRLGAGVDAQRRIGEAAQERLLEALRSHVAAARQHDADAIVAAATSAMRDAANRAAVQQRIRDDLGIEVEILSGAEEALWSFAAACASLGEPHGPVLVIDIGGGSLELIVGHRGEAARAPAEAIQQRVSLDVGCVRLTERFVDGHPVSPDAVRSVEAVVHEALTGASLTLPPGTRAVGTAGTATALALVDAGPESTWDPLHGTGFTLSAAAVHRWRHRLLRLSLDDLHALHPAAMQGRADVFPVGVLLLDAVLRTFALDPCRISPYELRHGLVLRALRTYASA